MRRLMDGFLSVAPQRSMAARESAKADIRRPMVRGTSCTLPCSLTCLRTFGLVASTGCDMVSLVPISRWDADDAALDVQKHVSQSARYGEKVPRCDPLLIILYASAVLEESTCDDESQCAVEEELCVCNACLGFLS